MMTLNLISKGLDNLLADEKAETIACMCYLDFVSHRPFRFMVRDNAEHMSPYGMVPFTTASEGDVASGFLPLVNYCVCTSSAAATTDVPPVSWSPMTDAALVKANEHRVDLVYVYETFRLIFLNVQWRVPIALRDFTQPRYSLRVPWPISSILTRQRRNRMIQIMEAEGKKDWTLQEMINEFARLCESLVIMLGKGPCFYEAMTPDAIDCLVFGFLESLDLIFGYVPELQTTLQTYPTLLAHQQLMRNAYFKPEHFDTERVEIVRKECPQ